jgi:hypothetical protein
VRAPVGGCAMSSDSRDPKQEAIESAQWVAKWRQLEMEALGIANALTDRGVQRHMLFVAEGYRLLAERAEVALKNSPNGVEEDR